MLRSLFLSTTAVLAALLTAGGGPAALAQQLASPLDSGFEKTTGIAATVDEMLGVEKARSADEAIYGPGYPDLWMMELQMKPVRMRRMVITDPKTGERSPELVWYMVYRLIPRDYTALAGDSQQELQSKLSNPDFDPQNAADSKRSESLVLPEFTIVTSDNTGSFVYRDQVNLEVQQEVLRREFLRNQQFAASRPIEELENSVGAIRPAPSVIGSVTTPEEDLAAATYGVAVWRNVDARTDYLTLYVGGLTNGFRIVTADDGSVQLQRKLVVQKLRRPGDQYLQDELEFRFDGNPRWEYLPDGTPAPDPALVPILRNTEEAEEAPAQP